MTKQRKERREEATRPGHNYYYKYLDIQGNITANLSDFDERLQQEE